MGLGCFHHEQIKLTLLVAEFRKSKPLCPGPHMPFSSNISPQVGEALSGHLNTHLWHRAAVRLYLLRNGKPCTRSAAIAVMGSDEQARMHARTHKDNRLVPHILSHSS